MQRLTTPEAANWILRIAVAGEFIGHGVFALGQKADWVKFFVVFGIGPDLANQLMPMIGSLDIVLGLLVLVYPVRPILLWMAFWGFMTALIRPLSGAPVWDFVERWANWGAPLALWVITSKNFRKNV
ncbi:hypothetical protein K8R04_03490 [Candidatus Uhrbacteria bacterium]|nr:hypothetical protein [Candidatus Uhrbacteria bacterium]